MIAYKTGGLKDTVFEYDKQTMSGNGITFEAHFQKVHCFFGYVREGVPANTWH